MNKKGFAATGILYTILVLFILLFSGMLTILYSRNNILIKIQNQVKDNVEDSAITYDVYQNGTPVYFNPVTGNLCDEGDAVSTTGTKTGCMKWYIFNDNITNSYVNMILDHNAIATVAWNTEGTNTVMKEVKTELDKLVSETNWKVNPRLITANEVATITGNSTFNEQNSPVSEWFYLDSNSQTPVANSNTKSNYAWLFDYTKNCTTYGCNVNESNKFLGGVETYIWGYWTATPVKDSDEKLVWLVDSTGSLGQVDFTNKDAANVNNPNGMGLRPVITIDKSVLKQLKYVMTNIIPDGSFENNGNGWYFGTAGSSVYEGQIVTNQFVTGNKSLYIFDDSKTKRNWSTISLSLQPNHKYYLSSFVKYESGNDYGHVGLMYGGSYRVLVYKVNSTYNQWTRLSTVNLLQDEDTLQIGTSTSNIASYYIDDIMLIDLTETFGSGNEPTKEWCDQNIDWFEGSKNIYK